jgi:DNA-binding winged helix-turn-helix (wHTH) protein
MTTIPPMIRARVDGISGRAFDLLHVLVSRPGEVVSKGQLMAKVLPDLTVEESNLRFHIAQLRRALSDGQGGERYVTNVSRRGYCFIAQVGCAASPYIQHLYGRGDLSC